ncbi:hypothetical protein [Brevibacterium permense]|uniref:hypothetical protein n=1 Tax=Brevibacterium permense TaxID=234834 RepID=UPI0021CF73BF|nr:hypothetical protein [Brevibacterium permense]
MSAEHGTYAPLPEWRSGSDNSPTPSPGAMPHSNRYFSQDRSQVCREEGETAPSTHVPKRSKLFDLVETAKDTPCPICRSKRGSWCRGNLGYPARIFNDCHLHVMRLEAAILADDSRRSGQSTVAAVVASASAPLGAQGAQDRTDARLGGEDHA